jgi:hypothetical protein
MSLDADEVTTRGSAAWWLLHLGRELEHQCPQLDRLNAYDVGNHPLPQGHKRAREAYRRFQQQARSNFVGLVTDAVLDRLKVDGFRMGAGDMEADSLAQLIWQANSMDAEAGLVHRDALVMRRSYVVVGPDDSNESGVLLTGEDPRQVIHAPDPRNRRVVRAALKTWRDEAEREDYAVVYLPDSITYYTAPAGAVGTTWQASRWDLDEDEAEGGVAPNPSAPFVPVVPFVNRPEKRRAGFGEFEDVTDVQDRINQTVLDRLVTGATQAFRQRWASGVAVSEDDQFDPGADLMWHVSDPAAKFGDFSPADLRMFIEATRADVEHLASISRTPPYYLMGQMVNVSGDALTAADAGLEAKAGNRMIQFGESWEAVIGLAFRLNGRAVSVDAETIWADPSQASPAALADAAVKKQAVGVPWRQLMEDLRYSPAQIDRMESLRMADVFQAALLGPPGPLEPSPPAGPQARVDTAPVAE